MNDTINKYDHIVKEALVKICYKYKLVVTYHNPNNAMLPNAIYYDTSASISDNSIINQFQHNFKGEADLLLNPRFFFFHNRNVTPKINLKKLSPEIYATFWKEVHHSLDIEAKILLANQIFTNMPTPKLTDFSILDKDIYNFFLSHLQGETQYGRTHEFKEIFSIVKNLPTPEIDSLQKFLSYFKPIVKKPDISPLVANYLKSTIAPEHYKRFEKILSSPISAIEQAQDPLDIMTPVSTLTLILDKKKILQGLKFPNVEEMTLRTLNSFFSRLVKGLKEPDNLKALGISNIYINEFFGNQPDTRLFLEGYKNPEIVQTIFYLINTCAHEYQSGMDMTQMVSKTLNYYLLEQQIPQTNSTPTKKNKI